MQQGADAARIDRCEEVEPAVAREPALAEAAATQLCAQQHPLTEQSSICTYGLIHLYLLTVRVTMDGDQHGASSGSASYPKLFPPRLLHETDSSYCFHLVALTQ